MILQHIVETLDTELERLQRLRAIVSSLQGSLSLELDRLRDIPPPLEELPALEPAPKPRRITVAREKKEAARKPASTAEKAAVRAHTALTGSIPAGPVVIPRDAVATQSAAKREQQASRREENRPQKLGTLGSMIRALHLDATA